MPTFLLGLLLAVFGAASMVEANRISTNLRKPGVFDLMGPDRYLMAVGAVMLLLGAALMLQWLRHRRASARSEPVVGREPESRTHLALLGVIVLYAVLMPILGYALSTLIFFLAAFRVMGTRSWPWSVGSAVAASAAFAVTFLWIADMPLPKGWLNLL